MPLGSSSDAPAMRPGPSTLARRFVSLARSRLVLRLVRTVPLTVAPRMPIARVAWHGINAAPMEPVPPRSRCGFGRRDRCVRLVAALERVGDEARGFHLLDEAVQIAGADVSALGGAHRLADFHEAPVEHPHLRMGL